MKKGTLICQGLVLVLALLLCIGTAGFLGPCVHEDGSFGTCHWAGVMLTALGAAMAALALAGLVTKKPGMRAGLNLGIIALAVVAGLVPGTLIPLCMMSTMRCLSIMQPASRIICGLAAVLALVPVFASESKG